MRLAPLLILGCFVTTLACSDKKPLEAGDGGGGTGGNDGSAAGGDGGSPSGGGDAGKGGGTGGVGGSGGKLDGGIVTCGPVCDIFCKNGHVLDGRGCPTCACNPEPKQCPPLDCALACPNGAAKDSNGCLTCACLDTGPCSAKNACPGTMPAYPNYICSDGKTLAGPACKPADDGTCHWTTVTCPPTPCPCPRNGLCVHQIGGPAQQDPPMDHCATEVTLDCGPACGCIANEGKCTPSPTVKDLCICDNGQR